MEMLVFTNLQNTIHLKLLYLKQKGRQFYVYSYNEAKDGYIRYNGMTVDPEVFRYREYYMTYQDFGPYVSMSSEDDLYFADIEPSINDIRFDQKLIKAVWMWPEKYCYAKILRIDTVDDYGNLSEDVIIDDTLVWSSDDVMTVPMRKLVTRSHMEDDDALLEDEAS